MKSLRNIGKLAAAISAAIVAASPAQADVMGSSVLRMTNFVINGSGGTQLAFSDFQYLTYTNTGTFSGSLTGTAGIAANGSGTPLNLLAACAGSGCGALALGDNTFPKIAPPPVAGNYVAADQNESGAPVTGLGLGTSATVENASYTGLTSGSAVSHAQSTNNLQGTFKFKLAQASGVSLSFDANAFIMASVTAGELFPGFATASYQMDFTLINNDSGATIFTYSPDLFAGVPNGAGVKTVSVNAPRFTDLTRSFDTGGPVAFTSSTAALNNTDEYQISFRMQTNVDAQRQAPEPATLSLLGLALLSGGYFTRRRALRR